MPPIGEKAPAFKNRDSRLFQAAPRPWSWWRGRLLRRPGSSEGWHRPVARARWVRLPSRETGWLSL